jgi:hypothetical protein
MAFSSDAEVSVRSNARLAGIFYLLNILTAVSALFAHGTLASAVLLTSTACYVAVTLLFYQLFRPVDRTISGLAALCSRRAAITTLDSFRLVPFLWPRVSGLYCLLIGYLIFARLLPRFLGLLMALGGLGLTDLSVATLEQASPHNMAPGILGEGTLTLWLLVAAVNARHWLEQSTISGGV